MMWFQSRGMDRLYITDQRHDQYKRGIEISPEMVSCQLMKSTFRIRPHAMKPEVTRDSPDTNPIENMWKLVKRSIAKELIKIKRQLIKGYHIKA